LAGTKPERDFLEFLEEDFAVAKKEIGRTRHFPGGKLNASGTGVETRPPVIQPVVFDCSEIFIGEKGVVLVSKTPAAKPQPLPDSASADPGFGPFGGGGTE